MRHPDPVAFRRMHPMTCRCAVCRPRMPGERRGGRFDLLAFFDSGLRTGLLCVGIAIAVIASIQLFIAP